MKVYDCCIFFDENLILDIRFNILNDHVDKFVVVEATRDHSGNQKKLNFDINNFKKFKDKINYISLNKIEIDNSIKLKKINDEFLPEYLIKNKYKYKDWFR